MEGTMNLRRIMAATDDSDAGRQAVRSALAIGARSGARVTIMQAVPAGAAVMAGAGGPRVGKHPVPESSSPERLQQRVEGSLNGSARLVPIEYAVGFGIPGIEICRYAEQHQIDLLVLGRKRRSQMARLLLGDTADAVARRSRVPCLFVPPEAASLDQLLVAHDCSERGRVVLREAYEFAQAVGGAMRVMTVETRWADEPVELASTVLGARTLRLRDHVGELLAPASNGGSRSGARRSHPESLIVRRGDIVEQVLATIEQTEPDVLAIGYHRGGPPGILEGGSTARRLAHTAPCAVLTIPL
jgi:nucleotide-binding universal stress UspA family protein